MLRRTWLPYMSPLPSLSPQPRERGRMRFHRLQNVQIALDYLKKRQVWISLLTLSYSSVLSGFWLKTGIHLRQRFQDLDCWMKLLEISLLSQYTKPPHIFMSFLSYHTFIAVSNWKSTWLSQNFHSYIKCVYRWIAYVNALLFCERFVHP